jgi:NitT/TauT family transport system permease protein
MTSPQAPQPETAPMVDKYLGDKIPEFGTKKPGTTDSAGLTAPSGLTSGPGARSFWEIFAIIMVAVFIIGSAEAYIRFFGVPQYVMPPPSAIAFALVADFDLISPHLGFTLIELFVGYAIGASIGLLLAAIITQFPFAEKIIAPYILMLVTTPMLALVPLLILRFGFGLEPRIIAVALASGPMVMINSATGFRRTDLAKIALARSFGATTFQIFTKIRFPMAMPMIVVGLMIGAIFGLLTAVGAEMVGGGFGLGNRLTTYSATLQMPRFFAVILILSALGILIYVAFYLIGKKWASWES